MIASQNTDLVKKIVERYRYDEQIAGSGTQVKVQKFKVLDLTFNYLPAAILKTEKEMIFSDETNFTLYGYLININGQQYFVNQDGRFHLEDENGFIITTLHTERQEDISIVYDAEISIRYVDEPDTYPDVREDYTLCEPFESYDKIKQIRRVTIAPNTNLLLDTSIEGYDLVRIDIEADTGTQFSFNGSTIEIGYTEFLSLEDETFSSLSYQGRNLADIIVRYYYKKGANI